MNSTGLDPWAGDPRPPRRWQTEAYPLVMASIRARERGVMQACTGAGKTRLLLAVLRTVLATMRPGYRVVVTVPRTALVEQTVADAAAALGKLAVAPWYGNAKRDARVIVACQDSLSTLLDHLRINRLGVALWVADECHRTSTDALRELVEAMNPATRLGITATPFRSVEADALAGWDRLVYGYSIDEAIADGVLVPFRVVPWRGAPDTDATEATIAMIRSDAPDGPGLVSAQDVDDARFAAAALSDAGIPAEAISSYLPKREVKARIDALLEGRLRCLVHVDLLTEGVDLPPLRWLAMRRPRGAAVAIVQEVGRVLRTMPAADRWGPKREAVLLLPHETPILASLSREAALTSDPIDVATKLREAAEREVAPRERVLPLAAFAPDVEAWLSALASAAITDGIGRPPPDGLDEHARRFAPTSQQAVVLRDLQDKHRNPARYLPDYLREPVKAVMRRPEALSRGGVSDLLTVLLGLRVKAAQYAKANGHLPTNKRFWPGWRPVVRLDPPDEAVRAWAAAGKDNR